MKNQKIIACGTILDGITILVSNSHRKSIDCVDRIDVLRNHRIIVSENEQIIRTGVRVRFTDERRERISQNRQRGLRRDGLRRIF